MHVGRIATVSHNNELTKDALQILLLERALKATEEPGELASPTQLKQSKQKKKVTRSAGLIKRVTVLSSSL